MPGSLVDGRLNGIFGVKLNGDIPGGVWASGVADHAVDGGRYYGVNDAFTITGT